MRGARYKRYLLGLLMAILAANYVDRLVLGIVLQDIKTDLHLSDTQLGFLSGLAFTVFYALMGIPLARWADRGNRVTLISLTTTLWSVAVALCGLAGSFAQLLLIRVGVAVGEAGCQPPALSLIADYFTRAERPRATAIYYLGGSLSFLLGYFLAGWLNEFYGWRTTFILIGAPGIALALLAALTLGEPRRSELALPGNASAGVATPPGAASIATAPSLQSVWRTLWVNATFRTLLLCNAILAFFVNGVLQWLPTFFIRSHDMQTGELGTALAVVFGIGGALGGYLGGALASRYAPHNEPLQLKASAVAIGASAILWMTAYLSSHPYLTFALIGVGVVVQTAVVGPLYATIQTLVAKEMRAMAFALVLLLANLIGMGLGPMAVGVLSDAFQAWAHEESIRYALLILTPGFFWVAWYAWRASRTVAGDVAMLDKGAEILEPEAICAHPSIPK